MTRGQYETFKWQIHSTEWQDWLKEVTAKSFLHSYVPD